MIKSMTGFASLTHEDAAATLDVTIRGVNHRYLDLQLRVPQALAGSEGRLRELVQQRVARGRIEITIAIRSRRPAPIEVELNEQFVAAVARALDRAREQGFIVGGLAAGDLLRFPQTLSVREAEADDADADAASLAAAAESATDRALLDLETMRQREGTYLRTDLERRRGSLADLIEQIAREVDQGREAFEARLGARVEELRLDLQTDAATIAQEVVRLVARGDVSEELVRFRGHLAHWQSLADGPEPCGRKLDFLLQEMNREINTIGAKAEGPRLSELVVTAKAELEKMREQVQNVE